MIYYHGGEPEGAMHCCHVTQAMDNSRICHRLLFHEHGKQNFVQPYLASMKVLRLHTRFIKLHTEVMSWISRVYECRLCMDLPEYYAWFVLSVSSLPSSVMVCSCLACVNFVPQAPSRWRCALAVALHQRDSGLNPSHARNYPWTFKSSWNIYMRSFKFYGIWPQTDIHTTSANAFTLVWGSLRLTPIM